MTIPFEAQRHSSRFIDAYERHVTAVRFEIRPGLFERLDNACLEALRMQPVEQEQAAHQIIASQGGNDGGSGGSRLVHDFEHAFNSRAVKFHEQLDEFLRSRGERGIIYIFNFL